MESVQQVNNKMYVLSQVFVVISGILFAISYFLKRKWLILLVNIFNNLFFATHFLLLKSFTAAYAVLLVGFFLAAVYFLEKFGKEKFIPTVLIVTLPVLFVISFFTWSGFISLMPIIANLSTLIGTTTKNSLFVKLFYLTSTILNTIFMFIIHSYFGFATNLVIVTVGTVGIINHIRTLKKFSRC